MKDLMAELIGTFALVFSITATIAGTLSITGTFTLLNLLAIAFTAGLALAALVYSLGPFSGGHFNPAVTIGLWAAKKFPRQKVIPYISAQFLGGIIASIVLWVITSDKVLGATTAGSFGVLSAVLVEIIATALFLIVILSVTSGKDSSHAGLAIGFYLLVAHLYGIPFSGASLNPARSLGPALLGGGTTLSQLWIYFVGPVVGAVLGAMLFRRFLEK
ncbi:MAG TPA: aquaporin [archaeon]|nr:aquaporin [archaeon]